MHMFRCGTHMEASVLTRCTPAGCSAVPLCSHTTTRWTYSIGQCCRQAMFISRLHAATSGSIASTSRSSHSSSSRRACICKSSEDVQAPTTTALSTQVMSTQYENVGPEPRRFAVEQPLNIATASLAPIMRLGAGALCVGYKTSIVQDDGGYAFVRAMGRKLTESSAVGSFPRPTKPLELYEFEGCPFCKKVREAVSMLDLDVVMYPCPQGGDVWRPKAIQEGGKKQFPYLKDPNTGIAMYESDAIIKYLFKTYGPGEDQVPRLLTLGFLTTLSAGVGLAPRWGKGNRATRSTQPAQPLVLWGYEGSPFVKVVREVLCEMQLPYLYHNVARGSPKREELLKKYGHFQVPCLEDPNTSSYLWESAAIVRYLQHQYKQDE